MTNTNCAAADELSSLTLHLQGGPTRSGGIICFRCGVPSLIILLFISVSGSLGQRVTVSCSPQTVCALRDSAVNLICSYSNTIKPQQSFWFNPKLKAKWRNEEDPEDLALDSDYAGRVRYTDNGFSSTLTITDLRERDSGEYQLMIITGGGDRDYSSAVRLTVSDLQVIVSPDAINQTKPRMTCSTFCNLTSETYYYWSKNGQRVGSSKSQSALVPSSHPGSYSCSVVTGRHEIYSSAVCVFGENCWNVRYSDRRLCAVERSSVEFLCSYSHPSHLTVNETFWYYVEPEVEPKDLSLDERFAGRVQFLGDKEGNCNLRMRDVRKNDSGEYHFRFVTNTTGGRFFGKPGIILTVTDLQVRASPSRPAEGQTVTLTCSSTCTLPNNPTYIWYKNAEPVTNKPTKYNKLYLDSASSEDIRQYSCALGCRGFVPEGPEHSEVLKLVSVAVTVSLTVILIIGSVRMWFVIRRRRAAERDTDVQTPKPGDDTYTALNPVTMSSDYDTLTNVTGTASDTYSTLNPATMTSDYDTLTHVTGSRNGRR